MFAQVQSLGVFALRGFSVTVEADLSRGLPQFELVGLPDSAVKESRDRVRSAIKNLGFEFPVSRITLNLSLIHIAYSWYGRPAGHPRASCGTAALSYSA